MFLVCVCVWGGWWFESMCFAFPDSDPFSIIFGYPSAVVLVVLRFDLVLNSGFFVFCSNSCVYNFPIALACFSYIIKCVCIYMDRQDNCQILVISNFESNRRVSKIKNVFELILNLECRIDENFEFGAVALSERGQKNGFRCGFGIERLTIDFGFRIGRLVGGWFSI